MMMMMMMMSGGLQPGVGQSNRVIAKFFGQQRAADDEKIAFFVFIKRINRNSSEMKCLKSGSY